MQQDESPTVHQSILLNQLHIYGLFGIAVAYPIFHFLMANPAYLVTNGVTSKHLYLIIVMLSIGLPAIPMILDLAFQFLPKRLYEILHALLITVLVAIAFLPLLSRFGNISLWLLFGITTLLTAFSIWEYRTNRFTYVGLAILAPIAVAFPIYFSLDHSISQILHPQRSEGSEWQAAVNDDLPPVVLVVFDAFPLVHLLDAEGNIDGKRFPNFASLGAQSNWYSNATTVHDQTLKAIPSILTGRYPDEGKILPLSENYPESLFNILRGHYRIHAMESATSLSGTDENEFEVKDIDNKVLVSDLAIFYGRSLLPEQVADEWLPLEDGVWGGFLARMPERRKEESQRILSQWQFTKHKELPIRNRYVAATSYINELSQFPSNTFHFFHIIVPHRPFEFLPSGRPYTFALMKDIGNKNTARVEREAHILHAGLADTILGDLKAELVEHGRWDDSMVIVVSDHGEAYQANPNKRLITPQNIGEVGFVPLLVKLPGQQKGIVDDSNVQTIDIAPTILDALDIKNGPRMDGRSLLDTETGAPEYKEIMSESGKTYQISKVVYDHSRAIAHKSSVDFFNLTDSRSDLFNYGPGREFVGVELDSIGQHRISAQIGVYDLKKYKKIDFGKMKIPVLVSGEILKHPNVSPNEVVVAISVNGVVKAVTTPFYSVNGKLRFHKVLPESAFDEENDVLVVLLSPI